MNNQNVYQCGIHRQARETGCPSCGEAQRKNLALSPTPKTARELEAEQHAIAWYAGYQQGHADALLSVRDALGITEAIAEAISLHEEQSHDD